MGKLLLKLRNFIIKLYVSTPAGRSLRQGENIAREGESAATPGMAERLRRAAAEGAVLLKNDGTLPLRGTVAIFGRVQTDRCDTGYGSGGDVMKPYRVSILEGIRRAGIEYDRPLAAIYEGWAKEHPVDHGHWGNWPRAYEEMPLTDKIVSDAAARAGTALVIIGRAAGEDRENTLTEGSYYLTQQERDMLGRVRRYFSKIVVVLNIGNIIDLSWLDDDTISAALLIWQGGMETGNACADLISGRVNPSGRLSASVARRYEDYPSASHFGGWRYNEYYEDIYVGYRYFETFAPDRTLFPFAFGLSYTTFSRSAQAAARGDRIEISYRVRNTGACAGKDALTVFVQKPKGGIEVPRRELVAFCKTPLLQPGEEARGTLSVPCHLLCVYDEARSQYVRMAGEYIFCLGGDVREAQPFARIALEEEREAPLAQRCAPERPIAILSQAGERHARQNEKDLRAEILAGLPAEYTKASKRVTFDMVAAGEATLAEFVSQLSLRELEAVSRGDYKMNSSLGPSGNAGVMGGVLPSLRGKGVPPVTMTDGPSGIRLNTPCSLLPIGTLLACSFDEKLIAEVYAAVGGEMKARGSHVLLAPGMNLQRDPLCGRNFEYFSEDPLLSGRMAAAAVRGLQSTGASACPKHFACNNQELNRNRNDSRLSERALRELYLRSFEICVQEGKPDVIMTSYNKINGVWAHYNYDLVRGILRGEWGFDGVVVTDWWMRRARSPQFPKLRDNAYRVRSGINVLMPGGTYLNTRRPDGTLLASLGKRGGITMGELQRNAEEILRFVLHSAAMKGKRS